MWLTDSLVGYLAALNFARLPKQSRGSTIAVRATRTELWFEKQPRDFRHYTQSFFFDNAQGQVVLEPTFEVRDGFVVRKISHCLAGEPHDGMRGWISGWVANTWSDLGISAEEVNLRNDGYHLPATQTLGSNIWVILVHGRTAKRAETYRAYKVFAELGYSVLAISLRNNFEATTTKNRRSHFGAIEWQDVDVAVRYARGLGAISIVFYGISMGAVSIAECVRNTEVHPLGVILDSPVVSWRETLDVMADEAKLTEKQRRAALWFIESKLGSKLLGLQKPVVLSQIGFQNWSPKFEVPMLLMHSIDDGYVDYQPSNRFAKARSEWVTLETFDTALHVQLWNHQPERYEKLISDFLRKLPK